MAGALQDAAGYTGVDFGSGIVLSPKLDPAPDYREDAFVVKLDASGNGKWGHRIGDASQHLGYGVAVLKSGQVLWTGMFAGTIALPGGLPAVMTDNHGAFAVWLAP